MLKQANTVSNSSVPNVMLKFKIVHTIIVMRVKTCYCKLLNIFKKKKKKFENSDRKRRRNTEVVNLAVQVSTTRYSDTPELQLPLRGINKTCQKGISQIILNEEFVC